MIFKYMDEDKSRIKMSNKDNMNEKEKPEGRWGHSMTHQVAPLLPKVTVC